MKHSKLLACLLALATVAGAASALADDHPVFSIGLGGQYWMAKDAKDILDEDGLWGGNIILRFQPAPYIGIDLRGGGSGAWDTDSWHGPDGRKYDETATFMCCPVELGLVLILPIADSFSIYGGGGGGYYYYDIDIRESSHRHGHSYRTEWHDHIKLEDDWGWYALGGAKINLAPHFALFGEARYTDTETKLKEYKEFKIDCSGVAFQVGFMFDF